MARPKSNQGRRRVPKGDSPKGPSASNRPGGTKHRDERRPKEAWRNETGADPRGTHTRGASTRGTDPRTANPRSKNAHAKDGHQASHQGRRHDGYPNDRAKAVAEPLAPSHPLAQIPDGHYLIPGRQPVAEALTANRPVKAIVCERNMQLGPIADIAQERKIPIAYSGRDQLTQATEGVLHQGIVAVVPEPPEANLNDHLHHDLVVIVDGITDARNLGAIARSAEQAGAGCLIVRARRAAGYSPAAEKAAAGAFSWLPVITVSNITNAVKTLQGAGMWTVALDHDDDAQSLYDLVVLDERVAFVVGEEGAGVSRVVKEAADVTAFIPMRGHLDSLNASVATGVALFEWARRHPA